MNKIFGSLIAAVLTVTMLGTHPAVSLAGSAWQAERVALAPRSEFAPHKATEAKGSRPGWDGVAHEEGVQEFHSSLHREIQEIPYLQDVLRVLSQDLWRLDSYDPDSEISSPELLKIYFSHHYYGGVHLGDLQFAEELYIHYRAQLEGHGQDIRLVVDPARPQNQIPLPEHILRVLRKAHQTVEILKKAEALGMAFVEARPLSSSEASHPSISWFLQEMSRLPQEFLESSQEVQQPDSHRDGFKQLQRLDRKYRQWTGRVAAIARTVSPDGLLHRVLLAYKEHLDQLYAELRDGMAVYYELHWPKRYSIRGALEGQVVEEEYEFPQSYMQVRALSYGAVHKWMWESIGEQGGIGAKLYDAWSRIQRLIHRDEEFAKSLTGLTPTDRKYSELRKATEANSNSLKESQKAFDRQLRQAIQARVAYMRNAFEGVLYAQVLLEGVEEGSVAMLMRGIDRGFSERGMHEGLRRWTYIDIIREMLQEKGSVDVPLMRGEGESMTMAEALQDDPAFQAMLSDAIGDDIQRWARRDKFKRRWKRLAAAAAVVVSLWGGSHIVDTLRPYFTAKPAGVEQVVSPVKSPTRADVASDLGVSPDTLKPIIGELIAAANSIERMDTEKARKLEQRFTKIQGDLEEIAQLKREASERGKELLRPLNIQAQLLQKRTDRPEYRMRWEDQRMDSAPSMPGSWHDLEPEEKTFPSGEPSETTAEIAGEILSDLPGRTSGFAGYGGGSFSAGPWVAGIEGKYRYLAGYTYSNINPLTGEYATIPPVWSPRPLGEGQAEGWVTQTTFGRASSSLLIPPGTVIVDIQTQNFARGSVYFDSANGSWYLKASENPGLVRVGVRQAQEGESREFPDLTMQESVRDTWKESLPPEVRRLLEYAQGRSVEERLKVKRDILGNFYYSTNPYLETLGQTEGNFLETAFTYYALKCDGFSVLNAALSHALELPLVIQTGYLDISGDQNLDLGEAHAWSLSPEGVEESTGYAQGVSPLFYKKNVSDSDWREEWEYIKSRAQYAARRMSGVSDVAELEQQEKDLQRELEELKAEMKELPPLNDVQLYQKLRDTYRQQLLRLDIQGSVSSASEATKLLQQLTAPMYSGQTHNKWQLMAMDHFLLQAMNQIAEKFPTLRSDVERRKLLLYEKTISLARERGWILREPLSPGQTPTYVFGAHGRFERQEYYSEVLEEYEVLDAPIGGGPYTPEWLRANLIRGDMFEESLGVYRMIGDFGVGAVWRFKKEESGPNYIGQQFLKKSRKFAVDSLTDDRIEIPLNSKIDQYAQGKVVVSLSNEQGEHIGFSLIGADGYEVDGVPIESKIWPAMELHAAADGQWLVKVEDAQERVHYLGPLADLAGVQGQVYLSKIPQQGPWMMGSTASYYVHMLPDGSWIDRVIYSDGTEGVVGTLAKEANLLGKKYAGVSPYPKIFSKDSWMVTASKIDEFDGVHILGPLAQEIQTATAGRGIMFAIMTDNGDWFAAVHTPDDQMALIGSVAKKLGVAEQPYRTIRAVRPEGLMLVGHEDNSNEWVGPHAKAARVEGLRVFSIRKIDFTPDGRSLGTVHYTKDSEGFMGSLISEDLFRQRFQAIDRLHLLPDGRWITIVTDGEGQGVVGPLALEADPEQITTRSNLADVNTMEELRFESITKLQVSEDGFWLAIAKEGDEFVLIGTLPPNMDGVYQGLLGRKYSVPPVIHQDGSFVVVEKFSEGWVYKGPYVDKGSLGGTPFPTLLKDVCVLPDGNWLAVREVNDAYEGIGSLSIPFNGQQFEGYPGMEVVWIDPEDGIILYDSRGSYKFPRADRPDARGIVLIVNGRTQLAEDFAWDYPKRVVAMHNIALSPEDFPFEQRLDLRWRRVATLAQVGSEGRAAKEMSALIQDMHAIRTHRRWRLMPEQYKYFDFDLVAEVLQAHPGIYAALSAEDLTKLVAFLRWTRYEPRIMDILLDIDASKVREVVAATSLDAPWWDDVVTQYIQVLAERYGVDTDDTYLFPFDFLPEHRAKVGQLNTLLLEALESDARRYALRMQALSDRLSTLGLAPGAENQQLGYDRLKDILAQLRRHSGLPETHFDVEVRPSDRDNPIYKAVQLFRLNSALLKVRYDKPVWDDAWLERYDQLNGWKAFNGKLNTILGEDFQGEMVLEDVWDNLWHEITTDMFGLLALLGFIYLVFSYASDALRNRDQLRWQRDAQSIIREIWKDNPWFQGSKAVWAQHFLAEIMPAMGKELTPQQLERKEAMRSGLSTEQRALFDIVCCVASESPGKAKGIFLRLFNLIPFASLYLVRDTGQHRARQTMNQDLLTFSKELDATIEPQAFYEGLRKILAKYGDKVVLKEGDSSVQDFAAIESEILNETARIRKLRVAPIRSYLLRPDGWSLRRPGQSSDFLEYREYVVGDDRRTIDEKRSARREPSRPVVRVPMTDFTKKASLLVDMRTLLEGGYGEKWIQEMARSLLVMFDKRMLQGGRGFALDKLIFLMPNGQTIVVAGEKVSRGRIHLAMEVLRIQYNLAKEMLKTRKNISAGPWFYEEVQRERYLQRIRGITEGTILTEESLRELIPRLSLRNEYLFAVGVPEGDREAVSRLLRNAGVASLFWDKNVASPYRPAAQSRSKDLDAVQSSIGMAL